MEHVEDAERQKDNSTRMYQAVMQLEQRKSAKKLIDSEKGKTINIVEQLKIITEHFRKVLITDSAEAVLVLKPREMATSITSEEVLKAVKSL